MFCKNCGTQIADNAVACPNCGTQVGVNQGASQEFRTYSPIWANQQDAVTTPQPLTYAQPPVNPKKGGKKKKPFIIAIALVLVVAIVVGIIAFAGGNPASKAFNAVRKTAFDSSEITITLVGNTDENVILSLAFGDDINSSYFDEKVGGVSYISLKNGKMYQMGQDMGVELETGLAYYDTMLSSELGVDVNITEEINKILNNKIDEDALSELLDGIVLPELEKAIKEETGVNVDLPTYDECMEFIEKLLKDKDVRKSLNIKKAKSDNPGKTYSYDVVCGDFATAFFEFVQSKDEYKQYLDLIVEINDYSSAEELISSVVKEAYETDNLQGTFTIKSGRLTNFTYNEDGKVEFSIAIESK